MDLKKYKNGSSEKKSRVCRDRGSSIIWSLRRLGIELVRDTQEPANVVRYKSQKRGPINQETSGKKIEKIVGATFFRQLHVLRGSFLSFFGSISKSDSKLSTNNVAYIYPLLVQLGLASLSRDCGV